MIIADSMELLRCCSSSTMKLFVIPWMEKSSLSLPFYQWAEGGVYPYLSRGVICLNTFAKNPPLPLYSHFIIIITVKILSNISISLCMSFNKLYSSHLYATRCSFFAPFCLITFALPIQFSTGPPTVEIAAEFAPDTQPLWYKRNSSPQSFPVESQPLTLLQILHSTVSVINLAYPLRSLF